MITSQERWIDKFWDLSTKLVVPAVVGIVALVIVHDKSLAMIDMRLEMIENSRYTSQDWEAGRRELLSDMMKMIQAHEMRPHTGAVTRAELTEMMRAIREDLREVKVEIRNLREKANE